MGQQLFCPVLLLETEELWTPSIVYAEPMAAYSFFNPRTNIVYKNILSEEVVLAWIGEYSHMAKIPEAFPVKTDLLRRFSTEIEIIPNKEDEGFLVIDDKQNKWISELKKTSYLINVDTNEYVDLSKYATIAKSENAPVDPLPWLTVVEKNKNSDCKNMGRWAFCKLMMSQHVPKDCKELVVQELFDGF